MTNLEALQSTVAGYPLAENAFLRVLTDRGISATDTYAGKTAAFELATADMYMVLSTAASISEGGYSVSMADKQAFMKQADAIYGKYADSAAATPQVRNATMRW